MVRLITHNLLACHAKTCQAPANFPLRFADCTRVEVQEAEFNAEFLRCVDAPAIRTCSGSSNFLVKIDWPALRGAARQLGDESLPEEPPSATRSGDLSEEQLAALQALHHVLLEDGNMICPSCSHVYAIKDGIPNMLLQEHELR